MLVDQVTAMREIIDALLLMAHHTGMSMYYDNDHRYADANDEFSAATTALRVAREQLDTTIKQMQEIDRD